LGAYADIVHNEGAWASTVGESCGTDGGDTAGCGVAIAGGDRTAADSVPGGDIAVGRYEGEDFWRALGEVVSRCAGMAGIGREVVTMSVGNGGGITTVMIGTEVDRVEAHMGEESLGNGELAEGCRAVG